MTDKVLIEHEGMLYRGDKRAWPEEVYDVKKGDFSPYAGGVPKGVDWGSVVTDDEAEEIKRGLHGG
jgi:hypothetical protein